MPKEQELSIEAVKLMVREKKITRLSDVFKLVPVKTTAKGAKIQYQTLNNHAKNPDSFKVWEMRRLSDFFGLTMEEIFALIVADLPVG